jgi:hypothetical protein
MLAVLNMKWAWRKKRIAQGKPHDKPNLVGRERGREGGRAIEGRTKGRWREGGGENKRKVTETMETVGRTPNLTGLR